MIETTSFFARTLALVACTVVFAGIWSNDRPATAEGTVANAGTEQVVVTEPEWRPVSEITAAHPSVSVAAAEITLQLPQQSKTFSVETADLLISAALLQSHLDQLPIGLPSGDYRIVDSLGGVGWLRVRGGGPSSGETEHGRMLSTVVESESVRFIRVNAPALGTTAAAPGN